MKTKIIARARAIGSSIRQWFASRLAWRATPSIVVDWREDEAPPVVLAPTPDAPPPVDRPGRSLFKPLKAGWVNEGFSARWHLRGKILDRLDEYFYCVRALAKHDRPLYSMLSRVGMLVSADVFYSHETHVAPDGFRALGCGGVLMPDPKVDEKRDQILASFIIFEKRKQAIGVEPTVGETYKLSVLYDDRQRRKIDRLTALVSCHVALEPGGRMRLLEELVEQTDTLDVGRKRRGWDGRIECDRIRVTHKEWRYPWWIDEVLAFNGFTKTRDEWAAGLLNMAIGTYASATEKIVVRAKRDGLVAAFGIDVARCKYFFRDRGLEALAADGKRKRIFHAVTEHERQLETRSTVVRAHFRGIRDFTWNGARVHIVLPENTDVYRHEIAGAVLEPGGPTPASLISIQKAGKVLAGVLDR